MKKMILLSSLILIAELMLAQSPNLDSAKNELYRINEAFDKSTYLGFNLDIHYRSDSGTTVVKTVETDELSGNYVLNKKNIFYQMGNTGYVQTDSFSYTIYDDEKTMIMTKNFVDRSSDAFPIRTFVDSILNYYGANYSIGIDTIMTDSANYTKRMVFTKTGLGVYDNFSIFYDEGSYLPSKIEFSYYEKMIDTISNTAFSSFAVKKTVTMIFSDYKAFANTGIFNDLQYVIYNRQRKIYEPAPAYREYRFLTSGFDNEDEDEAHYREVPFNSNN